MIVQPAERVSTSLMTDSVSYGGILIATFAVVFLIASFGQVLTCRWRSWFPGAEGERSFFGGVRSAVFTLMSYLP